MTKLFNERLKTSKSKDPADLTNYLIKIDFYKTIDSIAEKNQKNPERLKKNVVDLLSIVE